MLKKFLPIKVKKTNKNNNAWANLVTCIARDTSDKSIYMFIYLFIYFMRRDCSHMGGPIWRRRSRTAVSSSVYDLSLPLRKQSTNPWGSLIEILSALRLIVLRSGLQQSRCGLFEFWVSWMGFRYRPLLISGAAEALSELIVWMDFSSETCAP